MILRVLFIASLVAVAGAANYEEDAEDTSPITLNEFTEKYKEYLNNVGKCKQKGDESAVNNCLDQLNNKFRTITHRGVNSEVIEELSCRRGKFGKYEVVIDDNSKEVELPC